MEFALAATLRNPANPSVNSKASTGKFNGVFLKHNGKNDTEVGYTDLCLLCDGEDTAVQEYWYRGSWNDGCTTYWRNLSDLSRMPDRSYENEGRYDHGTVVSYVTLSAGEKKAVEVSFENIGDNEKIKIFYRRDKSAFVEISNILKVSKSEISFSLSLARRVMDNWNPQTCPIHATVRKASCAARVNPVISTEIFPSFP